MKGKGLILLSLVYLGLEFILTLAEGVGIIGLLPPFLYSWIYSVFGFIYPLMAFVSLFYVFAKNRTLSPAFQPQMIANQVESECTTNQVRENDDRVICNCCGKHLAPIRSSSGQNMQSYFFAKALQTNFSV